MAMFDIDDGEDVNLNNNKTSDKVLLKGKKIKGLRADGNQAGNSQNSTTRLSWLKNNFLAPLVVSLTAVVLIALIAHFWPVLRPILRFE